MCFVCLWLFFFVLEFFRQVYFQGYLQLPDSRTLCHTLTQNELSEGISLKQICSYLCAEARQHMQNKITTFVFIIFDEQFQTNTCGPTFFMLVKMEQKKRLGGGEAKQFLHTKLKRWEKKKNSVVSHESTSLTFRTQACSFLTGLWTQNVAALRSLALSKVFKKVGYNLPHPWSVDQHVDV